MLLFLGLVIAGRILQHYLIKEQLSRLSRLTQEFIDSLRRRAQKSQTLQDEEEEENYTGGQEEQLVIELEDDDF